MAFGTNVGEAWYEITARSDKLRRALDESDRRIETTGARAEKSLGGRLTGALHGIGGGLLTVAKAAVFVGGAGAAGLGFLGGMALKGAADAESMAASWEVLLGTTEAAQARMKELKEFAATTPFEIPEVMAASRQLQVFGGTALATGDNLRLVGDIAAGTQQPFTDVAMWIGRTYDAMKSGQPFGEAAQRLQEMGALSGDNRRKLEKLAAGVKSGNLTMDQAWKRSQGIFGQFSGMMEKQSQTLNGQISNLMDNIGQALTGIGELLLPVAKEVVGFFNTMIPIVKQFFMELLSGKGDADGFGAVLVNVFDTILEVGKAVWPLLQTFVQIAMTAIGAIIENVVPVIADAFDFIATNVIPPLQEAFAAIAGWVRANWPTISKVIDLAAQIIGQALGLVIDIVKALWPIIEATGRVVLPILGAAFEALLPFVEAALEILSGFLDFLQDVVMPIVETVGKTFSEVWLAVGSFFGDVWNGMLRVLGTIVGTMIGIIKNVVGIAADIPGPWQEGAKKQKAALEDMEAAARSWGTETEDVLTTSYAEQRRAASVGATGVAQAYADAFAGQGDYLAERVGYFQSRGSRLLEGQSPPKEGPWHEIDDWGATAARTFGIGFGSQGPFIAAMVRRALQGQAPAFIGDVPGAAAGAAVGSGGGMVQVNVRFESLVPYSPAQARAAWRAIQPEAVAELRHARIIR